MPAAKQAIEILFVVALSLAAGAGAAWAQDEFEEDLGDMQRRVLALREAGRYREAIVLCERIVARGETEMADEPRLIAAWVNNLAYLYKEQGRYQESVPLYLRAISINERLFGKEHPRVAQNLDNLATAYWHMSRYKEAEPLFVRGLKIREASLGPDDPLVGQSLNNLAVLYQDQGRLSEAEPVFKRALAIDEKAKGRGHVDTAPNLANIAGLYVDEGRYAEAEPLHRMALAIRERNLRKDHPEVAKSLDMLALLYWNQGRYAEAEPLARRALAIRESNLGKDHPMVADSLDTLALLMQDQGRPDVAEKLLLRSLAIREKALGPDHLDVARALNNLALQYIDLKQFASAQPLLERALAIREKQLGETHTLVAQSVNNLARMYLAQGKLAEAEPLHRRAITIREQALGADHPRVAICVYDLARLKDQQEQYADAEKLVERALAIREQAGVAAKDRFDCYNLRAQLRWKTNRKQEAVDDLNNALTLAEEARGQAAGGETQRAEVFANYASAYERMVEWQRELKQPGAALAAIERSRARSLMDQLATASVDFLAGVPAEEAAALRQRLSRAQVQLASFEKQAELLRADKTMAQAERERAISAIEAQVRAAREEVVEASVAIRNASPAYRQMVGQNFRPADAEELQAQLVGPDGVLLEYFLGDSAGYVVVIPPVGKPARLETLTVDEAQASLLQVEPGPLTAARMRAILANDAGTGVLQQLRQPGDAKAITARLAALWQILIPAAEQKILTDGSLKRWIVIQDAALAVFPFDTLVVEAEPELRYALDVAPPLVNAPSATLLANLAKADVKGAEGILSVGDVLYGPPADTTGSRGGALSSLASGARYSSLRGGLKPLPFTGRESAWVIESFKSLGIPTGALRKDQAREASVRAYGSKYEILHLACHGLVDQGYGNLFGALALTPGPKGAADPSDDGYLTLQEIYSLNLHGARLAILSACDTNFGPQQRGEGVWSLSRGFLVAGAQRVVASNWLVDDEAAATLIGVFCRDVAKEQKAGATDYAQALQNAKRYVRKQDKWANPYYWGTFVLVGPQ